MKNSLLYSLVFLSTLSISTNSLTAQNCDSAWSFGALYNLILPTGDIKDNGLGFLHGANFEFFYLGFTPNSKMKFQPGLIISGGATRSIENNVTLAEPVGAVGISNTYNSIADFKGALKFIPYDFGRFKPYSQVMGGIRFSGVQERLSTSEDFSAYDDTTEQQNGNWSGVYGVSLGLLIEITDKIELDLRTNYENTGQIEHIDINSNQLENYITSDAPINLGLNIGVRIRFGCDQDEYQDSYQKHRPTKRLRKKKIKKKEKQNTSISI